MATVIKPTIGRRVWFYPAGARPDGFAHSEDQAHDAGIAYVWSDRIINVSVADHNGKMFNFTSVTLMQEGDPQPSAPYCEWMPYQVGQAAALIQPAVEAQNGSAA